MVPPSITSSCEEIIKGSITAARPVAGGDINKAYQLETSGGSYFVKTNTAPLSRQMFEAEAKGLAALSSPCILRTPTVLGFGSTNEGSYLLLDFIETGFRPDGFWEEFGASLAKLHRHTAPNFCFDHDNFIGTLPQRNKPHDDWPSFYTSERLLPQLQIAEQKKLLQTPDFQRFEKLFERLPDICPVEPPALTHGDLWSGNFLCDSQGRPVLIDPAASYSHREMDLAMSRLFGGFDRPFYQSYEEEWSLEPGFEQRLPVYQLYYLMVHLNLFGGSYLRSVREVLAKYG